MSFWCDKMDEKGARELIILNLSLEFFWVHVESGLDPLIDDKNSLN